MAAVSASCVLTGYMDGTTVNGFLRVDGTPLAQRFNKGTDQFTPDFEAMAENQRPTVVPVMRDISSGEILIPNSYKFMYNGLVINFGTDGLSTNSGWEKYFKLVTNYSAAIGSKNYTLPAMRIMKNLVPLSGYNNDRISMSGTIEVNGSSVEFNEISTPVIIEESTGNQFQVVITNDKGSALTEQKEQLTETMHLYKDGVEVNDLTAYTQIWKKITGTGETNLGTARTQVISTDDVDNTLKIKCEVYKDGTIVGVGFDEITDFSDPYYILFKKTGITGDQIKKGQTATVTPVAVKRSSGEEFPELVKTWNFNIKDQEGKDFTLTGKTAAQFAGANAVINYADIQRAKMSVAIYASGSY